MPKRRLIGTITSVKMHETALVTVDRMKQHPLYGKRYRQSTVLAAHNPDNTYHLQDVVVIEEHRPMSKTKNWMIRERISANAVTSEITEEAAIDEVLHKDTPEDSVEATTESENE